ncbi:DUF262 domain-containing protein [Candidatus Electronema halotolerans]
MNFNTANNTFRQLLGNGLSYRVPPFQRDYSWTEEEWDDLWLDMLGLLEEDGEPAHYMGYLVLQSSDSKRFAIIDGQQRLTTLSVLVLASLSLLEDMSASGADTDNNRRRAEQLRNSYIGYLDPVSLVSHSKLELNRHNNRFYQTYLVPLGKIPQRRLNASEHKLRKAFIWFKERIKKHCGTTEASGRKLAEFVEMLADKLFFTVISVTDELNAFTVFETLNARGVRLSATDLLKNYLFSIISRETEHEVEMTSLEERWEGIVDLLGSESFPEFLRIFWNSRNRLVRKSELFKTIRKQINSRETAFQLLRDLDQAAAVYAALRDPQDAAWSADERQYLRQLMMFKVRQPLAMLMACYERYYEAERAVFTRIMRAVTIASFRYNVICNLPTHDQERLYNEIARNVSDKKYASTAALLAALGAVYPDDSLFKTAFAEKELRTSFSRNKKIVRYILFEIERQKYQQEFDVESATYSIEHILPEHPSEAWSVIEEAKQERMKYRLGNMTPLETSRNRELGNKDYQTKRAVYQRSAFKMTQAVAEHYDSWDEQKVESRQKRMADIAAGIWRFDF